MRDEETGYLGNYFVRSDTVFVEKFNGKEYLHTKDLENSNVRALAEDFDNDLDLHGVRLNSDNLESLEPEDFDYLEQNFGEVKELYNCRTDSTSAYFFGEEPVQTVEEEFEEISFKELESSLTDQREVNEYELKPK